jgi:hypothetical protein
MSRAIKLAGVTFTLPGLPSLWDFSFLAPNVVAWFAADQQLTVNGSQQVTNWGDLSGTGNTLGNPTPASSLILQPNALNNLPAVKNPAPGNAAAWVLTTGNGIGTAFGLTTPFSVAGLVTKFAGGTGSNIINNSTSTGAYTGWRVADGSSGGGFLTFGIACASGLFIAHGSTAFVIGSNYKFIVTYDGSGSAAGVQMYINGGTETMTILNNNGTGAVAPGPLLIGSPAQPNLYTGDAFYEFAVINRVLTAAEIASTNAYFLQKWGL